MSDLLAERARALTLQLLAWPSVTGTDGEQRFGTRLRDLVAGWPYFHRHPGHLWLEPAGDGRDVVCALVLGRGGDGAAAVLSGHYDTVAVEDLRALAPLAGDPEALREPLRRQLAEGGEASRRAAMDLTSSDWLPGRGALDMKSGLGAALAVLEEHAGNPAAHGSLVLLALPDEEAHSAGARAVGPVLARIAQEHDLAFAMGINCDCVTDDGSGEYGRQVFRGSVGKVLLCALVRGLPAHAGDPLAGLSAHALAAEVVALIEGRADWAGRAVDDPALPPPVLLHGGDTKAGYDVTMPQDVVLAFNLLTRQMSDERALEVFADRVHGAIGAAAERWQRRAARHRPDPVPVHAGEMPTARSGDVAAQAAAGLGAIADANGVAGPAAVVALGPVRYPRVAFTDEPLSRSLGQELALFGEERGTTVRLGGPYPHPSDISFLAGGPAMPWVNAGPWGRDFHQPSERLFAPYAFEQLPELITRLAQRAMRHGAP